MLENFSVLEASFEIQPQSLLIVTRGIAGYTKLKFFLFLSFSSWLSFYSFNEDFDEHFYT